jgi:hypothetical protein
MLSIISIFLEFVIVLLFLAIGFERKKRFGFFFALTFGIYVVYDLMKTTSFPIDQTFLQVLFFIATISALYGVWLIYNKKKS